MSEKRAPFDPGWHDPPTFNYSNAPPPTKTKLNLNKKIAFPMQSSTKSTDLPKVESSAAGLPMPFARVPLNRNEANAVPVISNISSMPLQPPPSMTTPSKSCESNHQELDSSPIQNETMNELGNSQKLVMNSLRGINDSLATIDSTKTEEIEKRLNILEAMWIDKKIDDKLKILLMNTAKALQANQFSTAIDLQRSIIVDHGSNVCAQWGPALRQLILLKESTIAPKSDPAIPDASIVDEPKFINTLDDQNCCSPKAVGRVQHL